MRSEGRRIVLKKKTLKKHHSLRRGSVKARCIRKRSFEQMVSVSRQARDQGKRRQEGGFLNRKGGGGNQLATF